MADAEAQDGAPKAGGKKKVLILMAGLMLAEAVAVVGVIKFLGMGPASAGASELVDSAEADRERITELKLLEARFQNLKTGRVWGWEAEVFMKVRQKNIAEVERIMAEQQAEIREGIALIFRRAEDRHLREPGMETMTRQLSTYVNEVFGLDPDEMPRIDRVLITRLQGFQQDV